jgi:hypothetical protein
MTTISEKPARANWFIDQLTLYQVANNSPEAVRRNFLVRKAEFELIVSDLRNKKGNDPLQHELILGAPGSGKSTLLRRIQVEIDEDAELAEKYLAVYPAEEQAAIYRLSDLWLEVLQRLAAKSLLDYSAFHNKQDYTRYLYSEIHQLLQSAQKKIVLLLDNLDRLLDNLGDEGQLLRETLLNYNDIQIVGASTQLTEHFWRYDLPFYGFFRQHRLERLQFEEVSLLLKYWGSVLRVPALQDYAQRHRGRVETVCVLTDGLPRTVQFFIQVLLRDTSLSGFDILRKIIDLASPVFQEKLRNLTPPQRKIAIELAFWWEACPTKTLAEKCRMEGKLIASYLKQMAQNGVVDILRTHSKNHLYRLRDRLFNLWLIVTQGNAEQQRRVENLVSFLEVFYGENEWEDTPQNGKIPGHKAYDDKKVLLDIWNGIFDQLSEKAERVVSKGQNADLSWFLVNLLYHEQKQLVLSLFESKNFGAVLRHKYQPIYDAALLIANRTSDNLLLKIPPEIMPAVQQLVADVKSKQRGYGLS